MNRSTPTEMGPPTGLARYGSAPGSLLASVADSVIGAGGGYAVVGSEGMMSRFFPGDSSCLSAESSCKASTAAASAAASADLELYGGSDVARSYGLGEISAGDPTAGVGPKGGDGGAHALMRHSSSPAGFFSNLVVDNGFSVTRGIGSYSQAGLDAVDAMASRRLSSQLSFSRQDSLSQISKISIPERGQSIGGGKSSDEVTAQSFISSNFPVASWDDTDSIMFSAPPRKRAKDNNGDIITSFSNIESQFSLPKTALATATEEDFFQFHQDSAPFKIRAKRGFATHPRSIAERERRTRISERLKKLQELVPNMDKQTNTADMLDLAVQHIKGLQSKVQKLNEEKANCTCEGSKR